MCDSVRSLATSLQGLQIQEQGEQSSRTPQRPPRRKPKINKKSKNKVEPHVAVVALLVEPHGRVDQDRFKALQVIRKKHDQAFERWLPHITLIPPFLIPFTQGGNASDRQLQQDGFDMKDSNECKTDKDEQAWPDGVFAQLESLSRTIGEVCDGHTRHLLLVDEVHTFKLRAYTNVHLRPRHSEGPVQAAGVSSPESSAKLLALQAELVEALPDQVKTGKNGSSGSPRKSRSDAGEKEFDEKWRNQRAQAKQKPFVPHVSVGQAYSKAEREELCDIAEKAISHMASAEDGDKAANHRNDRGLVCRVDRIQLMAKAKSESGAYRIFRQFELA